MSDAGRVRSFERVCYDYSHQWFSKDGVDHSELGGISVGKIFQLWVFEKLFEASQINADRLDLRSLLKRLNLEWVARSLTGIFSRDRDRGVVDYLLVFDVNNDPMINALNAIGDGLRERGFSVAAVTVDKNISRKCQIPRKVSWFSLFSFSNFLVAIRRYVGFRFEQMADLECDALSIERQFGRKKAQSITRYVGFQSLQLSFEIQAIRALLLAKTPKVVVLASDAHRVSRTFVLLCKLLGVKTVVYQHGATIWEYGYVPVFADRMLVWGRSSREWFERRGVLAGRLAEVGNLVSDKQGLKGLESANFSTSRKVYFFPNPIDRHITEMVLALFIGLCRRYALSGVVKLHPSERNIDFFEERISGFDDLVSISQAPISAAGVRPGDIAIVVNSTAGIDCCMYGALILNIEVETMPNPIDYEAGGVGLKAKFDDYTSKFERLMMMSPDDYFPHRNKFIRDYLGPLDGNAVKRACQEIVQLAD